MLLYRDKYYHDLTDLQEKYLHGHLGKDEHSRAVVSILLIRFEQITA